MQTQDVDITVTIYYTSVLQWIWIIRVYGEQLVYKYVKYALIK